MAHTSQTAHSAHQGTGGFHVGEVMSSFPRTIAALLGLAFLALGIIGFVSPGFMGTHLSAVHNGVHLITGAMALFLAFAGSLSATRMFNGVFGLVYLLLGLAGFLMGSPGAAAVGHGGQDDRLLRVIPNALELGTMDHIVHLIVGALFCLGAIAWRRDHHRRHDNRTA